jgi:hypothetical protein
VEGVVYGTGSEILGNATGSIVSVEGQDWGGWEINMSGAWSGEHSGVLNLVSGGGNSEDGYWLSRVNGSVDIDTGEASGASNLTVLTPISLNEGAGSFSGSFLVNYTWTGTETGSGLVNTPLDYIADYNSNFMYNNGGYISDSGYPQGLSGIVDNGDGTYDFLAIGEYYDSGYGGGGFGGPYVWSGSSAFGYEIIDGIYGDYGQAAVFTAGLWKKAAAGDTSGTMNGYEAIIYYTEAGEAGLLSGNIPGEFYEMNNLGSEGMFLSNGILTEISMVPPDGYDTSSDYISTSWFNADLAGGFSGIGANTIFGTYSGDGGETRYIYYYDSTDLYYKSLPFGIYNLPLGSNNYYEDKPAGDIAWSAKVGGTGYFGYNYDEDYVYWLADIGSTWYEIVPYDYDGYGGYGYGTIDGNMLGTYLTHTRMGTISGSFYGLYTEEIFDVTGSGTWIGISTGTYVTDECLNFGGDYYSSLQYNNGGYIYDSGYPQGRFGLVDNGDGTYDFLAIGGYSDYGYGEIEGGYGGPYVWSGSLTGYEIIDGEYGGYGGYGGAGVYTAGLWKKAGAGYSSGNMSGYAAGIYYTEAGEAGLLSGNIPGEFFEMNNLGYEGMFLSRGILTEATTELPVGYDPFSANFYIPSLSANLAGDFGDSNDNTIFGTYYDGGELKFITYYDSIDYYTKSLPFGIYSMPLGSMNYYSDKPAGDIAWSAKVGGTGYFGLNYYAVEYGYWLADIGSTWHEIVPYDYDGEGSYGYGTIDGDLHGTYLTEFSMGTISGPFYGLYTENGFETGYGGYGSWIGVSAGTYVTDQDLDFGGEWGGDSLYYYFNGELEYTGYDYGSVGLTERTDGNYDLLAIGEYQDYGYSSQGYGGAYVWHSPIDGDEIPKGGYGGFSGLTGGSWNASSSYSMIGNAAAIAATENGDGTVDAMLLYGAVSGDINEMNEMGSEGMWMTQGILNSLIMEQGITISTDPIEYGYLYFYGDGGFYESNGDPIDASIIVSASEGHSVNLIDSNYDDWGAWSSMLGGSYDDYGTGVYWDLNLSDITSDIKRWAEVIGDISGEEISADVAGAWVNIADAATGVMGGALNGMFDPSAFTWQAVAVGTFIDTATFLDMVTNNQTALQALNIPCVQVGETDLSGSNGYLTSVFMNGVKFFAYSTGAEPKIWATGDVNGTTSVYGSLVNGSSVTLSGTGFNNSVNFTINNYGDVGGKWDASVSGSGNVSGYDINITGGAAGKDIEDLGGDSGTKFLGTGAGVAKPYTP